MTESPGHGPVTVTTVTGRRSQAPGRWLAVMAVAYVVLHHAGTLFAGLGEVGETRWADWIDLLTPYVVIGAAAFVLHTARTAIGPWVLFGVSAVAYSQGQGIHLAANSVANVAPGEPAHLWDEVVGHYVWYGGLAGVVAALAWALARRPAPRGAVCYVLAALVGLTHFTNSVEGQFAYPGLVLAAVFAGWGWRTRDGAGRLLLAAYGGALTLFAVYGIWQGGFPEFSALGWI